MRKQTQDEERTPIRPVSEMSPKAMLAEKLRKQGYDCAVNSGVLQFFVGLDREDEVRKLLEKNDYNASWGVYPVRN